MTRHSATSPWRAFCSFILTASQRHLTVRSLTFNSVDEISHLRIIEPAKGPNLPPPDYPAAVGAATGKGPKQTKDPCRPPMPM
jgi:hypothetical protein